MGEGTNKWTDGRTYPLTERSTNEGTVSSKNGRIYGRMDRRMGSRAHEQMG